MSAGRRGLSVRVTIPTTIIYYATLHIHCEVYIGSNFVL